MWEMKMKTTETILLTYRNDSIANIKMLRIPSVYRTRNTWNS